MKMGKLAGLLLGLTLLYSAIPVSAVPVLQLYIEGATYNASTETWVITDVNPFKLWVIGTTTGSGGQGTISNVKLSGAVFSSEFGAGDGISLTSTTTGGFGGFTDPSTPSAPVPTGNSPSADGAVPIQGDGTPLPTHDIYGAGTRFFEWTLGDFSLSDSPTGDFMTALPTPSATNGAQINAYSVTVTGFSQVHFDAYDTIVVGKNNVQARFAPFSHDGESTGGETTETGGETTVTNVPEPSSVLLLGPSLLALGLWIKRKCRVRS